MNAQCAIKHEQKKQKKTTEYTMLTKLLLADNRSTGTDTYWTRNSVIVVIKKINIFVKCDRGTWPIVKYL